MQVEFASAYSTGRELVSDERRDVRKESAGISGARPRCLWGELYGSITIAEINANT